MKILRAAAIGIALAAGMGIAAAQTPPIPNITGPQDAGQLNATLNTLINQINAILQPLLPTGGGLGIPLGTGDTVGVIGLPLGSATNVGIQIDPNGSGDIILFGDGDTGTLKFGNTSAFVTAKGLTPCPGAQTPSVGKNLPFGVGQVISSYIIIQDWAGRKRGIPTC